MVTYPSTCITGKAVCVLCTVHDMVAYIVYDTHHVHHLDTMSLCWFQRAMDDLPQSSDLSSS